MSTCDSDELNQFIKHVKRLADAGHKLTLVALNDKGSVPEVVTLPPSKMYVGTPGDKLQPIDLEVKKIVQSIALSVTTFERNPTEHSACYVNMHGQWVCTSPF